MTAYGYLEAKLDKLLVAYENLDGTVTPLSEEDRDLLKAELLSEPFNWIDITPNLIRKKSAEIRRSKRKSIAKPLREMAPDMQLHDVAQMAAGYPTENLVRCLDRIEGDTGYRKILDWDSDVTFPTIGVTTWNFRVTVRRIGGVVSNWTRYQQTAGTDIADEPTTSNVQPATGGIGGAPVVQGGMEQIYGQTIVIPNGLWPTSGSNNPRFVISPGISGGWNATDGDGYILSLRGGGMMAECHGGAAYLQHGAVGWVTAPFPDPIPGTLVANEWGDAL